MPEVAIILIRDKARPETAAISLWCAYIVANLSTSFSYVFATILSSNDIDGNAMGRRARARTAAMADFVVTALGVAGLIGFLLAGRMDDVNASPFDVFAFVWFFTFGGIKFCLPWLLWKRAVATRGSSGRWALD